MLGQLLLAMKLFYSRKFWNIPFPPHFTFHGSVEILVTPERAAKCEMRWAPGEKSRIESGCSSSSPPKMYLILGAEISHIVIKHYHIVILNVR